MSDLATSKPLAVSSVPHAAKWFTLAYFCPGLAYCYPGLASRFLGLVYFCSGLVYCCPGLVYFYLGLVYFCLGRTRQHTDIPLQCAPHVGIARPSTTKASGPVSFTTLRTVHAHVTTSRSPPKTKQRQRLGQLCVSAPSSRARAPSSRSRGADRRRTSSLAYLHLGLVLEPTKENGLVLEPTKEHGTVMEYTSSACVGFVCPFSISFSLSFSRQLRPNMGRRHGVALRCSYHNQNEFKMLESTIPLAECSIHRMI